MIWRIREARASDTIIHWHINFCLILDSLGNSRKWKADFFPPPPPFSHVLAEEALVLDFLVTEGKTFFFSGLSFPEHNPHIGQSGRIESLEGSCGQEIRRRQVVWWGRNTPGPDTEKTGAWRKTRNLPHKMAETLMGVPSGWVGIWHQPLTSLVA